MRSSLLTALFALGISGFGSAQADTQDIRVLGWYSNQPQSQEVERPFWNDLAENTDGAFSTNFKTIDELSLTGFESLRTLKSGAFDVVAFQISFVGGEAPILMGADLPGAAFDFDQLEENLGSYRDILEQELDERFDAKLLTAWSFPFQVLFCKGDIDSLDDLKGKKVRVSGTYTAKLVEDLGAAGVTLAGPEVYQAMMMGVVDCAITGSQYGNSNDWFEVADTLSPIPLGGAGVVLHVATNDFWNGLSPEQQELLQNQTQQLEAGLIEISRHGHQDGINCNTGQEPCEGKLGEMKLLEPSEQDREKIQTFLTESIVPLWGEDCTAFNDSCVDDWLQTIGQVMVEN